MAGEQQKSEEPKVENASKVELKVYRCRECCDGKNGYGGCRWIEATLGPLMKDKCSVSPPTIAGKTPVWFVEDKKEEGEAEVTEAKDEIAEALDKHGVAIAIPEELKCKMSEELLAAVEAGAPVVVFLDRAEDEQTITITSTKDFRKAFSFAAKGNKITPEQAEQLQQDLKDLISVQGGLHNRIRAVEKENREGQDDVKEAREVLKEMEDMKKAKTVAEEAAKKEHEDWLKMFRDHKNMREKLEKLKNAHTSLKAKVKAINDEFNQ